MQYMLLIYDVESDWGARSEDERGSIMQEYFGFTRELREAGAMVAGAPLQPTATATTVRARDGERLVTDGPFAETKEQLGGFYLIDVESEEEALAWAAKMPSLPHGSVEVRPVMVFDAD